MGRERDQEESAEKEKVTEHLLPDIAYLFQCCAHLASMDRNTGEELAPQPSSQPTEWSKHPVHCLLPMDLYATAATLTSIHQITICALKHSLRSHNISHNSNRFYHSLVRDTSSSLTSQHKIKVVLVRVFLVCFLTFLK